MPGPRSALSTALVLTANERAELDRWQRCTTLSHGLVRRGQIVLLLADGLALSEVARRAGVQRRIVRRWGERFRTERLTGLTERPRSGRPPVFSPSGDRASGPARLRAA
jgi:hypothetical protein